MDVRLRSVDPPFPVRPSRSVMQSTRFVYRREPLCPARPWPGPTLPLLPCLLRVRQRERGRQDVINSLQWMMIDVGDNCRRAFDHRHLTDSQTQAALRAGPGPSTATGWRDARARERGGNEPPIAALPVGPRGLSSGSRAGSLPSM